MSHHKEEVKPLEEEGKKERKEEAAIAGLILLFRVTLFRSFHLSVLVWDCAFRSVGLDLPLQPLVLMTTPNS